MPDVRRAEIATLENGRTVDRYVLTAGPVEVAVLTWGATVQRLVVPDARGQGADVVLGFDDLASYQAPGQPYLGATVGRYANRIAGGRFELDGTTYEVPVNNGPNALHGGPRGFDRQVWSARPVRTDDGAGLELGLLSPDGDMGFPGRLEVAVSYVLREHELRIRYAATTDAPTVVNLTNHAYFALGGAGSGSVEDCELQIAAERYLPVDETSIPLGDLAPVAGTPMDFRAGKAIGADLREASEQLRHGTGYDHTWVLDGDGVHRAARARDPRSGRVLEVWTDQPGVQFYSANGLDGTLVGKGGRAYRQSDGFCLETQHFPDSPNQHTFPSTVLRPGQRFVSTTVWRFAAA